MFGDTKPIFSGESSAERFGGPLRDLTMGLIFLYTNTMREHLINIDKESIFFYLDLLRDSGETNMYGAAPYIANEFSISKYEARDVLAEWMKERSC